ncbi:hypothetical protein [Acinetobacter phage vB_AbaS_TCUP2199]|nr:hypothetical protein [Acinetobacter phage vB_AbaS_TCUP2199]
MGNALLTFNVITKFKHFLEYTLMNTINDKVLNTLNTLSATGKNATILLTIAKAINADKALPAWAEETLGQKFFINVLHHRSVPLQRYVKMIHIMIYVLL